MRNYSPEADAIYKLYTLLYDIGHIPNTVEKLYSGSRMRNLLRLPQLRVPLRLCYFKSSFKRQGKAIKISITAAVVCLSSVKLVDARDFKLPAAVFVTNPPLEGAKLLSEKLPARSISVVKVAFSSSYKDPDGPTYYAKINIIDTVYGPAYKPGDRQVAIRLIAYHGSSLVESGDLLFCVLMVDSDDTIEAVQIPPRPLRDW